MNLKTHFILISALLLTACGGGSSSSSSTGGSGTLSLNITDAPVDNASKVVVAFSSVTIKPANGPT